MTICIRRRKLENDCSFKESLRTSLPQKSQNRSFKTSFSLFEQKLLEEMSPWDFESLRSEHGRPRYHQKKFGRPDHFKEHLLAQSRAPRSTVARPSLTSRTLLSSWDWSRGHLQSTAAGYMQKGGIRYKPSDRPHRVSAIGASAIRRMRIFGACAICACRTGSESRLYAPRTTVIHCFSPIRSLAIESWRDLCATQNPAFLKALDLESDAVASSDPSIRYMLHCRMTKIPPKNSEMASVTGVSPAGFSDSSRV